MENAEIAGRSEKWIERIKVLEQEMAHNPDLKISEPAIAAMQSDRELAAAVSSPSLDRLRDYYRDALVLGQPTEVLQQIQEIAQQQKAGSSQTISDSPGNREFQMSQPDALQMVRFRNRAVQVIADKRQQAAPPQLAAQVASDRQSR
jgi:hypothetical protein